MVMYGPTAFLTKVSILLILTRVFEPFKKAVVFIYVFMALMLAYYIPAIIVKIRICMPVSYFWMGDKIEGDCLDQNSIILADAVMSVVSDLILLILPVPLGWQLQIPLGKKMRVIGVLGAGGLACASSIVRLVMIVQEANTTDSTYSFMRINMWGYVFSFHLFITPSSSLLTISYSHPIPITSQKRRSKHWCNLRLPPRPIRPNHHLRPRIRLQERNQSFHPRNGRSEIVQGSQQKPQQDKKEL